MFPTASKAPQPIDGPSRQALPAQALEDRRFIDLLSRLKPHGGLLSDDEFRDAHEVGGAGFSLCAGLWRRELLALDWRHRLWLPLFQFRGPGGSLSAPVAAVVNEWYPLLQGFDLLDWFLEPNAWLRDRCPIDLIDAEPVELVHAARADRFVIAI